MPHRSFDSLLKFALVAAALGAAGCASASSWSGLPHAASAGRVARPLAVATGIASLAGYKIDPSKVFVAGISSGGFLGVQMHFAHATTFKGAAIYAGGVDYCATDSVELALLNCGGETLPTNQASYNSTLAQSEQYVDRQSALGTIDPTSAIAGQPVYLWSGTNDSVVNPREMADLASEYRHYGANVRFDNAYPAEHGWESPDGELACGIKGSPYMIACASGSGSTYDSVQTWLTQFFGTLNPRATGPLQGTLAAFDQTEFGASAANSMDTTGYTFVPKRCASGGRCGLVLALHGCLQNRPLVGTTFATESGIDEWADTNGIVVLYPYAVQAPGPTPYNPQGCWDWWGYDDPNYALKSGTQMSIVYRMVERVLSGS